MMQTIYLLSEPRTKEPRYVGVTSRDLAKRMKQHRYQAMIGQNRPVCNWHRKLIGLGLEPIVSILEITQDRAREAHWIAEYRKANLRMLNLADGGNHAPSSNPEVAAKIAASLRGRKLSPEHLENCRNAPRPRHTDATRAKMRKPKTAEHREKAAAALRAMRQRGECRVLCGDDNPSRRRPERLARGERGGNARLTEMIVLEMRRLAAEGLSTVELGKRFGMKQSVAWGIVRGHSWKHLPGATAGPGRGARTDLRGAQ